MVGTESVKKSLPIFKIKSLKRILVKNKVISYIAEFVLICKTQATEIDDRIIWSTYFVSRSSAYVCYL